MPYIAPTDEESALKFVKDMTPETASDLITAFNNQESGRIFKMFAVYKELLEKVKASGNKAFMDALLAFSRRFGDWSATALHYATEHPDRFAPFVKEILSKYNTNEMIDKIIGMGGLSKGLAKIAADYLSNVPDISSYSTLMVKMSALQRFAEDGDFSNVPDYPPYDERTMSVLVNGAMSGDAYLIDKLESEIIAKNSLLKNQADSDKIYEKIVDVQSAKKFGHLVDLYSEYITNWSSSVRYINRYPALFDNRIKAIINYHDEWYLSNVLKLGQELNPECASALTAVYESLSEKDKGKFDASKKATPYNSIVTLGQQNLKIKDDFINAVNAGDAKLVKNKIKKGDIPSIEIVTLQLFERLRTHGISDKWNEDWNMAFKEFAYNYQISLEDVLSYFNQHPEFGGEMITKLLSEKDEKRLIDFVSRHGLSKISPKFLDVLKKVKLKKDERAKINRLEARLDERSIKFNNYYEQLGMDADAEITDDLIGGLKEKFKDDLEKFLIVEELSAWSAKDLKTYNNIYNILRDGDEDKLATEQNNYLDARQKEINNIKSRINIILGIEGEPNEEFIKDSGAAIKEYFDELKEISAIYGFSDAVMLQLESGRMARGDIDLLMDKDFLTGFVERLDSESVGNPFWDLRLEYPYILGNNKRSEFSFKNALSGIKLPGIKEWVKKNRFWILGGTAVAGAATIAWIWVAVFAASNAMDNPDLFDDENGANTSSEVVTPAPAAENKAKVAELELVIHQKDSVISVRNRQIENLRTELQAKTDSLAAGKTRVKQRSSRPPESKSGNSAGKKNDSKQKQQKGLPPHMKKWKERE
ncbi:MAG: hypothetical protein LBK26_03185 [Rickettsiales bacterium]|jgi:hypothetical protein|nr:hypothetical protein [Rickettsiales bacterium]